MVPLRSVKTEVVDVGAVVVVGAFVVVDCGIELNAADVSGSFEVLVVEDVGIELSLDNAKFELDLISETGTDLTVTVSLDSCDMEGIESVEVVDLISGVVEVVDLTSGVVELETA